VQRHDTNDDTVLARVGPESTLARSLEVTAGSGRVVLGWGPEVFAEDRRLLGRMARAAAEAVDARQLADQAQRAQALAEVDRLRAALLAAVGHDLRTPLASIRAAADTLTSRDVALAAGDRNELLATIVSSADRLSALISNLLDLSRLEAGAVRLTVQPVGLDEVVGRALIDMQPPNVENAVGDDLPLVHTDAGLLERIVENLVDNASRHSPPDRSVRIVAEAMPSSVVLRIVDHGPGVPIEDWDRMFVAFQRLDDRDHSTGVGLGLAIAQGFTQALGGTLRPEQTPGGGLTMAVTLPLTGPAPPQLHPATTRPATSGPSQGSDR
jgi:two-component system sensor histidine kinase KdpD